MNIRFSQSYGQERGSIVRKIAFALFALLLSGIALFFALYWVPLYIDAIIRTQTYNIEKTNATRYYAKMYVALRSYFEPYAEELFSLEKRAFERPLIREDFERALALPNVQEAFWVEKDKGVGVVVGDILPIGSLLSDTSILYDTAYSHSRTHVPLPDTLRPWTSLRYSIISLNGVDYTIALRDIRRQGEVVHETIGLIMLTEPIIKEGTRKLTRLFADPIETEFQGQNTMGKQGSFGLLRGSDTLYWWGDRDEPVVEGRTNKDKKVWHYSGSVSPMSGLNVSIVTKAAEFYLSGTVEKASKMLAEFSRVIVVMGLVSLYLLGFSLVLANRQSRRNQIALGHLAHSVKTPVARLQLAADILEGGQVSTLEEERKIIQTVSGECRQLRRAVENAALSMEGGNIAIHKESGDIAALVKETTNAWQQSFDQVGIRLAVEGVEKPLQFSFDRDKLRLALDNLIDNALRHTYLEVGARHAVPLQDIAPLREPLVTVELRNEDKSIILSVSDSGASIPQADMKNVFKRFRRSGKDPLTGVSGLGLGLALVKEIAEGHEGKVTVETAAGSGARFVIELPNA